MAWVRNNSVKDLATRAVRISLTIGDEGTAFEKIDRLALLEAMKTCDQMYFLQRYGSDVRRLQVDSQPQTKMFGGFEWREIVDNFIGGFAPTADGRQLNLFTGQIVDVIRSALWPNDLNDDELKMIKEELSKESTYPDPCDQPSVELLQICSPYTVVYRDKVGQLTAIGFHRHFKNLLNKFTGNLVRFAKSTGDEEFMNFCTNGVKLLLAGRFRELEQEWLLFEGRNFELIFWPTDSYSDYQFGHKRHFRCIFGVRNRNDRLSTLYRYLKEIKLSDIYEKNTGSGFLSNQAAIKSVATYWNVAVSGEAKIKPVSASNLPNGHKCKKIVVFRNTARDWLLRKSMDGIRLFTLEDQALLGGYDIPMEILFARIISHEYAHGIVPKAAPVEPEQKNTFEELKAELGGVYLLNELFIEEYVSEERFRAYLLVWISSWLMRRVPRFNHDWYESAGLICLHNFLRHGAVDLNNERVVVRWERVSKVIRDIAVEFFVSQQDATATATFIERSIRLFQPTVDAICRIRRSIGETRGPAIWGIHDHVWLAKKGGTA